jgi:hypothetical protein
MPRTFAMHHRACATPAARTRPGGRHRRCCCCCRGRRTSLPCAPSWPWGRCCATWAVPQPGTAVWAPAAVVKPHARTRTHAGQAPKAPSTQRAGACAAWQQRT